MTIESTLPVKTALERLAASPEEQEAYLRRLGVLPSVDELALELDDAIAGIEVGNSRAKAAIQRLDEHLDAMSGEHQASLWTPAALRDASEWATVRTLAREALAALDP